MKQIVSAKRLSALQETFEQTLDNPEGAIKNGQSRENGNIVYTRRRKTKQKCNTICVGHHYT